MIKPEVLEIVEKALAGLGVPPGSCMEEGTVSRKHTGLIGYHMYSICSTDAAERDESKHVCFGSVIAKDEETAKNLSVLVTNVAALVEEVKRLREANDFMTKLIYGIAGIFGWTSK